MASKRSVMAGAIIGMTIGGAVPILWGGSPLDGWSILGGMIGGFAGIWVVLWLSKRFEL